MVTTVSYRVTTLTVIAENIAIYAIKSSFKSAATSSVLCVEEASCVYRDVSLLASDVIGSIGRIEIEERSNSLVGAQRNVVNLYGSSVTDPSVRSLVERRKNSAGTRRGDIEGKAVGGAVKNI